MATFSDILKKARSVKGLSQAQLAKAAEVDHTVVSRWERGIVVPRAETIERLSQVLGVDLSAAYVE